MSRFTRLRQLAVVDITPLREISGFRTLFSALFFGQAGRELTVVAVPIQIYTLTGSTLAVGLLGLAQLIPLLLVSLVGGALADAVDRRRLLLIADGILALTAAGLLVNALLPTAMLWPLYVLSGVNAGVAAIYHPARQAMLPGLVGRAMFPSALALNQTQSQLAKTVVPAIGGLMIAAIGLPATYAAQTAAFVVSAYFLLRLPPVAIEGGGRSFSASSIREGFAFLKARRLIQAVFLIDFSAMVFGMPSALFPAFGTGALGGDEFTVGLLYAAPGAGALLAAMTSGWVPRVRHQGRGVVIAVVCWGVGIALFGLTTSIMVAFGFLAFAGAADVVSAIFRQSITQLSTPDSLRGRLTSIHTAASGGGPRLGDLEAGLVAQFTSPQVSIVSGGIACAVAALGIARWAPSFATYVYSPAGEMSSSGGNDDEPDGESFQPAVSLDEPGTDL